MARTLTPRLGLPSYSADADSFSRSEWDLAIAALEAKSALYASGTRAARPAAGIAGRFYTVAGDTALLNGTTYYDNGTTWSVTGANVEDSMLRPSAVGTVPLTVQGLAGQTGDLLKVQSSAAVDLLRVTPTGAIVQPQTTDGNAFGGVQIAGVRHAVYSAAAGTIGQVVKGAAGQTGVLSEWRSSADSALTRIDAGGRLTADLQPTGAGSSFGGASAAAARVAVGAAVAGTIGLLVVGAAGQTADLLRLQSSGGTTLAAFDSGGNLSIGGVPVVTTTSTQTLTNKTVALGAAFPNRVALTDGNGNLIAGSKSPPSGAYVGDTDTQTLTNKTLTSPQLSSPVVSGIAPVTLAVGTDIFATGQNSINRARYFKFGNLVWLELLIQNGNGGVTASATGDVADTTLCYGLPAAIRPAYDVPTHFNRAGILSGNVMIRTDGSIDLTDMYPSTTLNNAHVVNINTVYAVG